MPLPLCCRPGLESLHSESERTRYTVDFHKAPFTGLGLTFASHPETGEVRLLDQTLGS